MKKKWITPLLSLCLACCLLLPALAHAELGYVTDAAGLLTQEEQETLSENAALLAKDYALGVYIITVDDITDYVDAPDMISAAETLYLDYQLGETEKQNGILLLLSMAERDYALFAFGYGNTAFTDYGKDYLSGYFLDDLGEDDWYQGFEDYQRVCGEMVAQALEGEPVDVGNAPVPFWAKLLAAAVCLLLGLLIATSIRALLKAQMKPVAAATNAEAFVTEDGLQLHEKSDHFTHCTLTRVYDPPKSESGSSGGTTIRSSGGSGSSGKF